MTPNWLSNGVTNFAKLIGNKLRKNEKAVNTSKNLNKVVEKGGNIVDGGFDIFVWFKNNWQLAFIGFIAIFILLRD